MLFKKLLQNQTLDINKILFLNYVKLGLNETEFVMLLHLFALNEKNKTVLSFNGLKNRMTINASEVSNTLNSLISKGFLEISSEMSKTGKEQECFDIMPTLDMVSRLFAEEEEQNKLAGQEMIIEKLEREFARILTPIELSIISNLSKEYSINDINMAIIESVKMGKINLKYIEAILKNSKDEDVEINPEDAKAIEAFYDRISR